MEFNVVPCPTCSDLHRDQCSELELGIADSPLQTSRVNEGALSTNDSEETPSNTPIVGDAAADRESSVTALIEQLMRTGR